MTPAAEVDIEQPDVGLRILAVGDDAPVLDAADQFLHGRMVETHDREAVERNVFDEGEERVLDRVESLEMVEVLGVDVGDDRDVRRQLQEGAVAFVGFDHHPVAAAAPRIRAIGVDDAAVDDGRIEAGGVEQRRHQRSCGRLAVRAGDRDALLEAHQLGEHFRPPHYRYAFLARSYELRVVALDRGRDDDHGGFADVLSGMADMHLRAVLAKALHIGVVAGVRALHAIAERDQHFGDAGHADAADADEVDRAKLARQFHAVSP